MSTPDHDPAEPVPPADPEPGAGMIDPRTITPGPEILAPRVDVPAEPGRAEGPHSNEADPEEPEPEPGATGLIDPRPEIPGLDAP